MMERYNRKYNLISFILLRKNDEYLSDNRYYLNDQSYYEKVDYLIERRDLVGLVKFFSSTNCDDQEDLLVSCLKASQIKSVHLNEIEQEMMLSSEQTIQTTNASSSLICGQPNRMSDFTNSYNCNLFVYTVRKCLENEFKSLNSNQICHTLFSSCTGNNSSVANNCTFLDDFIEFLFSKKIKPSSFYLIDGDFPKRNLMHYSARYNYTKIAEYIINSFEQEKEMEDREEEEISNEKEGSEESEEGECKSHASDESETCKTRCII